MCQIETLYGLPVDIEWAYAAGRLHVLQARPITTYVPLPAEMVSAPDERRVLYADIALSGGFAINAPISPMGLAWMEEGVASLVAMGAGRKVDALPFEERLWFFSGARMYQNLSNVLWLASPEKLAKSTAPSDALMAEILSTIDVARYRAPSRPRWLGCACCGLSHAFCGGCAGSVVASLGRWWRRSGHSRPLWTRLLPTRK